VNKVTPVSLGYPVSVFNKTQLSKKECVTVLSFTRFTVERIGHGEGQKNLNGIISYYHRIFSLDSLQDRRHLALKDFRRKKVTGRKRLSFLGDRTGGRTDQGSEFQVYECDPKFTDWLEDMEKENRVKERNAT